MIEIKDLLGRFNNLLLSEEIKIAALQKVLQQTTGVEVEKQNIIVKNNTVYLDIKPIYKSEIFLKKEEITLALKETLGTRAPEDIR